MLDKSRTEFAIRTKKAIDDALTETATLENGDLRVRAVKIVYIDKLYGKYSYEMACDELNYCKRVISTWLSDFIQLVGKNLGMTNAKKD